MTAEEITEHDLIERLWLGNWFDIRVIGFGIWHFDLPFLVGRSWMNGLRPPRWLDDGEREIIERPYPPPQVLDLQRRAMITIQKRDGWSLGYCAEYFGLPTEPYGSGADVAEWYAHGEWGEIRKHLEADVLMTRDLYNLIGY